MCESNPDLLSIKHILVAKLRHHGDVVLTSPFFSILRNAFPHAKIDAYIYAETAPMLQGHPGIDGWILYDQKVKKQNFFKKLRYETSILKKIHKEKYDLVINLTEGDRGALAAWISRAKIRIGFDPEGSGMFGKSRCYTHLARRCPHIRHTVERQLDVLRCLGIFPSYEERELFFHVPTEAYENVKILLTKRGVDISNFIMIHPVSRWLFKCLPEKTMGEVVSFLVSRKEKVVLTGSSDPLEILMNQKILQYAGSNGVVDLSGILTLKELGALIDMSKLLICVDSLPLHLASCLKARVIALFGPTSEKTWAPWRNPYAKVLAQEYSCRPCYMPGCGGSRKSDCLETMPATKIIDEIERELSIL